MFDVHTDLVIRKTYISPKKLLQNFAKTIPIRKRI